MNFKVGDIVTGKSSGGYSITTNQAIMKVVKAPDLYGAMTVEIIKHDKYPKEVGGRHIIWSKSVTLVKQQTNEIIIYQKDNKVIAEHKEKKLQAIARCHPDDEFNFMTGAKLALERLDEMLNPPLYYVKLIDGEYGYLNMHRKNFFTATSNKEEKLHFKTKFTIDELKVLNPNYLPFAIKVKEDDKLES